MAWEETHIKSYKELGLKMSDKYDYIIVGAGTAGLVLANRLSEDPGISVLVLEAGEDRDQDPRVATPGLWRSALQTDFDWQFETIPQANLNGRIIKHPQGKLLGGSSSINAQAIVPPSPSDIDVWEKIGNSGWNWETLEPYLNGYFSLSEPAKQTHDRLDLAWSNGSWATGETDGLGRPVKASFTDVEVEGPLASAWVRSVNKIGFTLSGNPYHGSSTGPYTAASTVDPTTKTRVSASIAYYKPIKDRENLHVQTGCIVEKILIGGTFVRGNVATGVQYNRAGETWNAIAVEEVILAAGALQSPKLLELSGIGDPEILNKHNIDVNVENPFVGTNLQDHLMHPLSFEVKDGGLATRDGLLRREQVAIEKAMGAYKLDRSGPLSSSAISSGAYLPVDDFAQNEEERRKFLEELSNSEAKHPLDVYRISVLRSLIEDPKEGTAQFFPYAAQTTLASDTVQSGSFITVVVALSHPLSTGTVHVASADPSVKPIIDHRYLSNPLDVELQARHVRFIEKIVAAEPIVNLLKPNGRRNHDAAFIGDDLKKAKEYLKMSGTTNFHSVGTCAMAPQDSGGVVDAEFRVYGVKSLRVVDASVFPLIPQSNTQSLVYAAAERAAEIIRGKPKLTHSPK